MIVPHFSKSPFALTASARTSACWSGRLETLDHLKRLLASYARRSDSSLDIMWANLGAGKSHVLYHIAYQLTHIINQKHHAIPVIVEMPEQVRSFHDLYCKIVSEIPEKILAETLAKSSTGDLKQAGQVLLHGGPMEREVTREWIIGGRPHLANLKNYSRISRRIENDVAATEIFCGILKTFSQQNIRIVLMIDEFQRLSVLRAAARETLLSSLRSIFSHTPEYFSVILAAAFRVEKNATDCLTPELRSLLGHRPSLSLPEMSESEALDFICGRFKFFRPSGFDHGDYYPFDKDAVEVIVNLIKERGRPLIPREILQGLAFCYDELIDNAKETIKAAACKKTFENLKWNDE